MGSLKQFIRDSKVIRERFAKALPARTKLTRPQLAVPPNKYSAQQASCIGTAFDYLLRFHVQRLNLPVARGRQWVAEGSVNYFDEGVDVELGAIREQCGKRAAIARQIIIEGKNRLADFLVSGHMTEALIQSTLALATLDPVARVAVGEDTIGQYPPEGVEDLQRLLGIVPSSEFIANRLCLLNPLFNASSQFVLGADADLVLDDTIIDIKTTNQLKLNRSDVDQLLGYFLLNEIVGFADVGERPKIASVGIYFSRYACLYKIPIRGSLSEIDIADLAAFFREQANEYNPQDLDWQPIQPLC